MEPLLADIAPLCQNVLAVFVGRFYARTDVGEFGIQFRVGVVDTKGMEFPWNRSWTRADDSYRLTVGVCPDTLPIEEG